MDNIFQSLLKSRVLFDSHCHLNDKAFDIDRDSIIQHAEDQGVEKFIDIAVDIESSNKSLELSRKHSSILATAGIHPEILIPGSEMYQQDFDIEMNLKDLEILVNENLDQLIMLGEMGLDFYWLNRNETLSDFEKLQIKDQQKLLLKGQLKLAEQFNLPVTLHSRGSVEECIKITKEYKVVCIFHSLTNDDDDFEKFEFQVDKILGANHLIGLNGIITYKSAEQIKDVFIKKIGKIRNLVDLYQKGFVLETDAPYLTPSNYKSMTPKRNDPTGVSAVWQFLKSTI